MVSARWMWSLHGFLHGIEWIMYHGHLEYSKKPHLGGTPNTKSGEHGTPNAHNRWLILFYHVFGLAWREILSNSVWSRAWSNMTLDYTWGSVTTIHDFGGVLGRPLDTFFWALTIPCSWLLVVCEVTLIAHPHLLVQATNERWVPTLVTTSGSHSLKHS